MLKSLVPVGLALLLTTQKCPAPEKTANPNLGPADQGPAGHRWLLPRLARQKQIITRGISARRTSCGLRHQGAPAPTRKSRCTGTGTGPTVLTWLCTTNVSPTFEMSSGSNGGWPHIAREPPGRTDPLCHALLPHRNRRLVPLLWHAIPRSRPEVRVHGRTADRRSPDHPRAGQGVEHAQGRAVPQSQAVRHRHPTGPCQATRRWKTPRSVSGPIAITTPASFPPPSGTTTRRWSNRPTSTC
ncbi:MAG: hypothetical protein CM1200mP2_51210 [Planctomycetaceae bacterium]|nr:MAG: hypothetical protein CM1200mP2_51210 [Planctomycetaceae bacterium]